MNRSVAHRVILTLVLLASSLQLRAQQGTVPAAVAAKLGYPEMVLVNGKIVTMDDDSFESRVGTIAEAMAVRGDRILAVGKTAEIRPLAGPSTKVIDLQGRTVLPGLIITHEHPTDWAFQEPHALTHNFPDDSEIIHRWMPNISPKEQIARFEPMMREMVAKSKPGQWLFMSFNYGPDYENATEMGQLFAKSIKKEYLDLLAPNNPVKVRNGFITSVVNTKAMEIIEDADGEIDPTFKRDGFGFSREIEPNAMFRNKTPKLANVLKTELELWASYGAIAFASSPYSYSNLRALRYLDAHDEMPTRFAWGYPGDAWDLTTMRYLANNVGMGSDHLWMIGAFAGTGGNCMTAPVSEEWKKNPIDIAGRRGEGQCSMSPGSEGRKRMETVVKAGMRIATIHTGGDKDIDNLMDIIEQASAEGGFTLDDIRAKRHAFDHSAGAPRPAQIPRMVKLGMMASLNNNLLWEPPGVVPNMMGTAMIAKVYGTEYTSWVSPRQSLTRAHVMTGFEIDRPLPHKIFFFVTKGMNRYNDRDKMVYGPGERTDRIIQLKALTRWGAYYMLREKVMGTLEAGKFADFIILNKDYLTIPEEEIPSIRPLMTVVGGKTVHLMEPFAGEVKMQPVGATAWKEKFPEGW
jgi:predicted amidohydrolase YtcJ